MKADPESHPETERLESFFRGTTTAAENRPIVLHLLRGCPQCQGLVRKLWYQEEIPMARLVLVGRQG